MRDNLFSKGQKPNDKKIEVRIQNALESKGILSDQNTQRLLHNNNAASILTLIEQNKNQVMSQAEFEAMLNDNSPKSLNQKK